MTKLGKKNQKRLAKFVALTLMCAGGLYCLPSVAMAEITTTGTVPNDLDTQYTSNILDKSVRMFWIKNSETVWTISGGTYDWNGTAGYNSFNAGHNRNGYTFNITGGTWNNSSGSASNFWEIIGASNASMDVTGNHVNITGGIFKNSGRIIGGNKWSDPTTEATVSDNHVNISGGTWDEITGLTIAGGYDHPGTGAVKKNTVTISVGNDVTFTNTDVYGGYANGDVSDNTVTINGGSGYNVIVGGYTYNNTGNAELNHVNINGGIINGNVIGGESAGGAASNNEVNLTGGTVGGAIYGGKATNGNVTGNHVNFLGGTTTLDFLTGGYSNVSAVDNHVNIGEGSTVKFDGSGYGTWITGGDGSGDVEKNTVTISGTISPAKHGFVRVYGGETGGDGKNAKENVVTITGNAAFDIDAAEGDYLHIVGGYSDGTDGSAIDNVVTIDKAGLSFNGAICGGYAAKYPNTGGTATGNTVNILAAMTASNIYGGQVGEGGTSSNNTLNVAAKGVTVTGGIYYVQNLNFYMPADIADGDTMLTVQGVDPTDPEMHLKTDLSGVAIGAAVQSGATLAKGNTVNLITNPNGLTTDDKTTMKQITDETVTIQTALTPKTLTTDQSYKLEVSKKDDTTIIATITDVEEKKRDDPDNPDNPGGSTLEEKTKSLVETRAATTTFVNAGADMLASQGFAQAANAVALDAAEAVKNGTDVQHVGGFTPFAAFGGSGMRAESGSHVDTKGFGLNIGFARELPNSQGKLLFGPVVEYGGGSYDSHLDDGTKGEGGAHYFGVGLMARQVNHDGFYYEGSVRGGRVTSDYESNDIVNNRKVGYDSSSNYWAAHLGVGKAMNVGGNNTVDAYLKYFYSHQSGDDVAIKFNGNETGDRGNFDSVDSNRIRIGARLTHKINDMNSIYGGLAYQYEFGGEARAHFTGVNETPSPSVKGSSGMLELGWQVKPGGPVTIDLGVTGWAGKQRGGSVQLGATWTF